jgi:hypothetical protein
MLVRHLVTLTVRGIFHLKDLHAHLGDATVVRGVRDIARTFAKSGSTAVISGGSIHLPAELTREAVPFALQLPDHDELQRIVHQILRTLNRQHEVSVTLGPDGMESLLQALSGLTLNQARQAVAWAVLDDALTVDDIPRLFGERRRRPRRRAARVLSARRHHVSARWIGTLEAVARTRTRRLYAGGPCARAAAARGILIVGVQGCGKSLAAKVIAHSWKQPLLKLDAARLYDKFIGESEKNLRKTLDFAEAIAPCILWIDEMEKGFASGGEADAGLSQRMLGSFLTWLQEREASVFVAATANDVLVLPPELLRKGRFDEIFFVDLPDGPSREEIFRIHLALRRQDPATFDLGALVAASDGFSGAEIEQAITAGLYRALHDKQPMTNASLCEEIAGNAAAVGGATGRRRAAAGDGSRALRSRVAGGGIRLIGSNGTDGTRRPRRPQAQETAHQPPHLPAPRWGRRWTAVRGAAVRFHQCSNSS